MDLTPRPPWPAPRAPLDPDAFPSLCCPRCKGDLATHDAAYECTACRRTYPIVLGIPDFRVFPDPWIGRHDDHQKGRFLAANAPDVSFADLVRYYWTITPNVPPESVERFTQRVVQLGVKWAEAWPREVARLSRPPQTVLDLGCGTGGLLVAAAREGRRAVGVDLAFRWLVVARKRLEEAGLEVPLVCACAEHLPFRDGQFDLVVGEAVVEHLRDQPTALRECARVGAPGGHLHLLATNRMSLAPEPHVGVWGVGFLPRRWMPAFVRLVKGVPYPFLRLVSRFELARLLRGAGFTELRFELPALTPSEASRLGPWGRRAASVLGWVRRIGPLAAGLSVVYPLLDVMARAPEPRPPAGPDRRPAP